jgi:hypothetical protein
VRHRFPALTPQQVAQRMVTTGDAITYDQPIGPKLNAHRAVSAPLVAVEDGPAAGFGFDRLAPNPFRSATTLSFTTVAPGPVRLRLYDFAGRLVREIASEHLPAGPHTRTWNGADASGHALPSGVYFATLESGVQVARGKIVLLR